MLRLTKYDISNCIKKGCIGGGIDTWSIGTEQRTQHQYTQLIFGKGTIEVQWSKDSLFNKWCWNNWRPPPKK